MTGWEWVLVGVAGALGAPIRYVVDTLVSERVEGAFPLGTFVVNLSGSFILGLITGLALYHGLSRAPTLVLGTGLIGAYTTFSTFSFETLQLAEAGEGRAAVVNVLGSVVTGTLAAAAGLGLAGL